MSAPYGAKARLTYIPDESFFWLKFPKFNEWAVAEIKARIPSEARTYDPDGKRWLIDRSWSHVAIFTMEVAFGGVEIEDEEPQQSGSKPEPIRRGDPNFSELHLLPSAPWPVVEACYRAMARLNHPDKGGDVETMKRVNLAFESLQRRAGAA